MDATATSGLLAAYVAVLGLLAVFGLHRLVLLLRFRWPRSPAPSPPPRELPHVTVQLPLFNERTVVERLLRAVGALDYPRDRLQVQVLDDSTDDTSARVEREVERLRAQGLEVEVLRRARRNGYKAGALAEGLARARGELVCIFDADFEPPPRFLLDVVGPFGDPQVGMVQARWGHANRLQSRFTRAQATLLDGHFVVEHTVRHARGLFFNFNGTAGIWRRAAIESAGGWQHDTLTEDLDLSYRAQLAGWRFVYMPQVVAPAEVPGDLAAFRTQQQRWARGSVQVARKLLPRILRSPLPLRVRAEALVHLLGNAGYPLVLALALLLPLGAQLHERLPGLAQALLFGACTLSVLLFYDAGGRALARPRGRRWADVVCAVALGIGMSLGQTRAVLQGLGGATGAFERTPKAGGAPARLRYAAARADLPGLELAVAAWIAVGIGALLEAGLWPALPFHLLFFAGFTWVGSLSWVHRARRPVRREEAPCPSLSTPKPSPR